MPILEVKNLTHSYDNNSAFINDAIKDINFCIEKGEIIGIIGHTGSGKSTLVQHLNGLLKPTSGEVLFGGKNIWDNPKEIRKIRSDIGLVFQYPEYQLFEETVYADIAFGPKNMGVKDSELDAVVRDTCRMIGVKDEYLEKSPFDLSGGEKRRVAIAGVLAMRPKIIIFDEPTAGLDPVGRENIIKIITDYRNATGATILIVSHSMEDMAVLADRILVLNNGKLEMFDTVQNVFSKGDELRKIGLNTPIVTRVFDELRSRGLQCDGVFDVESAVSLLKKYKAGDRNA